ncbi:MAG: prepilin-type N-terminal cleavage/methylation domain-containing protein [Bilifractor sp.]|nr:prepilin-type N-terminal cleavage/methylation domain-containing protein [Bilifractor sp.]
MRREDNKGFTLAELLIVVAIIGVLVAISIPIFSKQLEKARDATSVANLRSAYAEAMTAAIDYNGTKLSGSPTRVTSNGIKMDLYGQNGVVTAVVVHGVYLHSKSANNWSGMASNLPFYNLLSTESSYAPDSANHADSGNYDGYYNIYFKLYSKDLSGQLTGVYIYQQAYDAKGNHKNK